MVPPSIFPLRLSLRASMTQAIVSLGLPPRPPKKELLSHDLGLENSDYSSGEDDDSSSRKHRSGGGGSAQPLAGVSADCEGPNWSASVQQFDNFLCRVHAQVRQNGGEREGSRRGRERENAGRFSHGENLVPFFPLLPLVQRAKLFSQVERSPAPCRRSTALSSPALRSLPAP